MDVFMLLDRTGSMARRWSEAVRSINVYADELTAKGASPDDQLTLAVFDRFDRLQFDADFDAFHQAGMVGVPVAATMSSTSGNLAAAMHSTARATMDYAQHGKTMAYSNQDREGADEKSATGKTSKS